MAEERIGWKATLDASEFNKELEGMSKRLTAFESNLRKSLGLPSLGKRITPGMVQATTWTDELNDATKKLVRTQQIEERALRKADAARLNSFFNVLGLTFSLQALNKVIGRFTGALFQSTNEATNYQGALSESQIALDSAKDSMLVTIGTTDAFTNALGSVRSAFAGILVSFGEFISRHEGLASILGYLVGILPVLIGSLVTLGTIYMVLAGVTRALGKASMLEILVPFGQILIIIGALVLAVYLLTRAWNSNFLGIRDITAKVFSNVTAIVKYAKTNLLGAFVEIGKAFLKFTVNAILSGIKLILSGLNMITSKIGWDLQGAIDKLSTFQRKVGETLAPSTQFSEILAQERAKFNQKFSANGFESNKSSQTIIHGDVNVNASSSFNINDFLKENGIASSLSGGINV